MSPKNGAVESKDILITLQKTFKFNEKKNHQKILHGSLLSTLNPKEDPLMSGTNFTGGRVAQ